MILGFTGTREGMTVAQIAALPIVVRVRSNGKISLPERVLHGGAVGADTEFDEYVVPKYWGMILDVRPIVVFPVGTDRWHYWKYDAGQAGIRHLNEPTHDPLARNREIVRRCDWLLACPATQRETQRGGTWYTVRQAREARKPRTIILPNGEVVVERLP